MEGLIIIEAGQGGALSSPSFECALKEKFESGYIELSSKMRDENFDTYRAEAGYELGLIKFKAQYWHNENTRSTLGASRDTVVLGASYDLGPVELTYDWSPDAFNAGERNRIGIKTYVESGRWSYWGWGTTRHFSDRGQWNEEYWNQISYALTDNMELGVRQFDSDYFGSTTSIRLKVKR